MRRATASAVVVAALAASSAAAGAGPELDAVESEQAEAEATDETKAQAETFAVEGRAQPFHPTYDAWFGKDHVTPRYGRAAVEIAGLMAAGLLYYWNDPLANKEDWDNPSIEDRVTFRSFRFDTNLNTTNHLLHPLAGSLVYGTARVNGLPISAAFAYGVAQSALWELALEWREKTSANDLVYTALGGAPLGELGFQLGEYVNSAGLGGGVLQEAAAWTLGFPRRIHRFLDGDTAPAVTLPRDRLGFSSAYGHDFAIVYEPGTLSNDAGAEGVVHTTRVAATIVAMPGFQAPGRFQIPFVNGNFTEMRLRLGATGAGIVESDLEARATLLGHYTQSFTADDGGDLEGHAAMLGIGPAMRFQRSKWLGREDQLSTVHLPGPHAEVWLRSGSVAAQIGGEAYPDFASIESLAYPSFGERYGSEGTKSVLQRQGYAYSLGAWARLRSSLAIGPATVGGSVGYGTYGSIEGLDRFQERLTRDVHGSEEVLEVEAAASVRLASVVTLGAGFRERQRGSVLGDVVVRRWDRNLYLSLGLSF